MITDREIADKRNEVLMLRLQINEHKERRRLDEIEQLELDDVLPSRNELVDRLESVFAVNRQQEDTIDDLGAQLTEKCAIINEITRLRVNEVETREALEADLKASHTNNAALSKALEEANTTLYNAKNAVEGLEADLSNSKSAIMMKNGVINDRVEHLDRVYNQLHGFQDNVYEKNKTIDELNETISDLRMAASDMLDTINECARGEAEDSRVLMQIVGALRDWQGAPLNPRHMIERMLHIVEDYSDAQESPVVTLKTPSMGTRVVSKNEETHTIDENKMEAVRMLVGSDMWVLHTDEASVEDKQQKDIIDEMQSTIRALKAEVSVRDGILIGRQSTIDELKDFIREQGGCVDDRDNRIDQLMVLNEALRVDIELAHNLSRDHIAGQDRTIEELKSRMTGARIIIDNQATTIEDFKAIETKETDRLHETIEGNGKIIDELNDMYCDVCGKLERIEKIAEHPAYDCCSTAFDEITKIIQEE